MNKSAAMRIEIVTSELQCPRCFSFEMKDEHTLNIRAFKVCDANGVWHSQCLVCKDAGAPHAGWFCTEMEMHGSKGEPE